MQISIDEFNPATDTQEYLDLVEGNMRHLRGKWVAFLLMNREKKQLKKFLSRPTKLFTIHIGPEIVAFTGYTIIRNNTTSFMEQLHVKAPFRDQGIGTQMLEFLEKRAREAGCTWMESEVYRKNPAYRLYKRFGFRRFGLYRNVIWWVYKIRKAL